MIIYCPYCDKPSTADEYDDDSDMYYMHCDNGHWFWTEIEDESWK